MGMETKIVAALALCLAAGYLAVNFFYRRNAKAAVLRAKLAGGALVLDVRGPAEYAAAHYPGAHNLPVEELSGRLAELGDRGQSVVVYCASGARSAQAAKILKAAGFSDVTDAGAIFNLPAD